MATRRNLIAYLERARPSARTSSLLGVAALALAGSAVLVNHRAAQAERDHLPKGRFVTVEGVRLHYVEKGSGPPVVFLHGNGAMLEDMLISGVFDHTATAYRAFAFDRSGFGHSERPHDRHWTAAAQASLFAKTFAALGLVRPIVVGHSWGTLVALALALNHPQSTGGLVLASGYYFPTSRSDVALFSPPALPVLGDVISYTVAPLIGEAIGWPLIAKMFAPQPVSPQFEREFPMALALRPSQIKAFSQDTSHMITAARQMSPHYGSITCPTVIMAGDDDRIVNIEPQSQRLHAAIPGSRLDVLNGAGHMIHHLDPARIVRAIDLIATGGITRASMEVEAATWGTRA
ncbi:MAG TPA: alpha/beta hydrolase [Hyphomicrobiaceae bacterium]|nr:alpha/beta hydrolase [Hyphomicrobiaceae bacterium]